MDWFFIFLDITMADIEEDTDAARIGPRQTDSEGDSEVWVSAGLCIHTVDSEVRNGDGTGTPRALGQMGSI